jgi:Flp pilus assembly pilin Flp
MSWWDLSMKRRGASLVEYGLLLSLLVVVCIAALVNFGIDLSTILSNLADLI